MGCLSVSVSLANHKPWGADIGFGKVPTRLRERCPTQAGLSQPACCSSSLQHEAPDPGTCGLQEPLKEAWTHSKIEKIGLVRLTQKHSHISQPLGNNGHPLHHLSVPEHTEPWGHLPLPCLKGFLLQIWMCSLLLTKQITFCEQSPPHPFLAHHPVQVPSQHGSLSQSVHGVIC